MTSNKIQGDFPLQLRFVDDRVFLSFFNTEEGSGDDVPCQVKDGKLMKFVHTDESCWGAEDPFEQVEISLPEFIDLIKNSILKNQK
jgi:hypothetical protein